MRRRDVIAWVAATAGQWPLVARAQQARVWRVGIISPTFPPLKDRATAVVLEKFRQRLRELGYAEGNNLVVDERYAEGQIDRLPALANELVSMRCDVIVAVATPAIAAAQRATSKIPIVMSPATDPIGSGFVKSFARPGGNITGVANLYGDMVAKTIEFLHAIVPGARKLAVLMSSNPTHPHLYGIARAAAESLGLSTIPALASTPDDLDRTLQDVANEKCDALFVLADPIRPTIVPLTAKYKIPAIFQFSLFVDAGGLASYGASVEGMFIAVAQYVGKILKGADPGDLPVEQPTTFEFALNLKTARSLGLSIPQSVISRADRMIE